LIEKGFIEFLHGLAPHSALSFFVIMDFIIVIYKFYSFAEIQIANWVDFFTMKKIGL